MNLQSAMSMLHCAKLEEVVVKALEGEAALYSSHEKISGAVNLNCNLGRGTEAKAKINNEHHRGIGLMMSWLFMQYRLSQQAPRQQLLSNRVVMTTKCYPPT